MLRRPRFRRWGIDEYMQALKAAKLILPRLQQLAKQLEANILVPFTKGKAPLHMRFEGGRAMAGTSFLELTEGRDE